MQLHQLDKRIRRMLQTLEALSVIQTVPVEGLQASPRGENAWTDFADGGPWSGEG